jgi:hypothetical protein
LEREEKVEGRLMRAYFRDEIETVSALIFPRQCLLIFQVKVCWTQGKALGNEDCRDIRSGLLYCYAAEESS